MSWSIGYDEHWQRDIGYGVPAICDHPQCHKEIDRGLSYVCGGEPYGGERGCGLYFCGAHLGGSNLCPRCRNYKPPYAAKPDTLEWITRKLTDESWQEWRDENTDEVARLRDEAKTLQRGRVSTTKADKKDFPAMITQGETREALRALVAALRTQAEDNGCYCETDISPEEAGIPISERCPYCLMGLASKELDAVLSTAEAAEKADALPGTTKTARVQREPL